MWFVSKDTFKHRIVDGARFFEMLDKWNLDSGGLDTRKGLEKDLTCTRRNHEVEMHEFRSGLSH